MRIEFFGAAGEVTGSCHLLHVGERRVLLDCGMVQGGRDERTRNAAKFAFDVRALDAMVLSHAHIDHLGRLPLLSRRGYRGPVFTHRATADLAKIMLEDAARLAMADAEHENRRRGNARSCPACASCCTTPATSSGRRSWTSRARATAASAASCSPPTSARAARR